MSRRSRPMQIRHVRQAISSDSLFGVLASWCNRGAGKSNYRLRILSAFVSGSALRALTPLIDVFLSHGNYVDIIAGIDRGGTDKNAIISLRALKKAYNNQVNVHIFHAPAKNSIFHPKLYILENERSLSFVVGSSNLTICGLASNFESIVLYEDAGKTTTEVKVVMSIWKMFSNPEPPLKKSFLRELTKDVASDLIRQLPQKSHEEKSYHQKTSANLWKSLSRINFPHSGKIKPRKQSKRIRRIKSYLLTDILSETRQTQMQIPLNVVENFFGVEKSKHAKIQLSLITDDGLSHPITRPIVLSGGMRLGRLMRRLEMPVIRGLTRPLTAVFIRLPEKQRFAFTVFSQHSPEHKRINRLLNDNGQQGKATRRYYIGQQNDGLWKQVRSLI